MNMGRELKRLISGIIFAIYAFSFPFAGNANAYSWRECSGHRIRWNDGWTNMCISTTSFPAGSSWDSRLQNAMWHWNNVKGSRFDFYVVRDTDGTHDSDNGDNEVYMDDNIYLGGALAVTRTRYHCYWLFGWHYGIDETDIEFNGNPWVSWDTGTLNYSNLGSPYNFESVALHELGHALGLLHEDRWLATMNSYYANSGPLGHWKEWDPLADDRQGARYLYPDSTTEVDIAASVFKRTGSGSSGLVSSPSSAAHGSSVTIEYTLSNQGTSTQSFTVGFYLSRNAYISTSDVLLGTSSFSGPAGAVGTFTRTLTIPSATTAGTYYLGFFVDHQKAIGEANEDNNYMEMPRQIVIK